MRRTYHPVQVKEYQCMDIQSLQWNLDYLNVIECPKKEADGVLVWRGFKHYVKQRGKAR